MCLYTIGAVVFVRVQFQPPPPSHGHGHRRFNSSAHRLVPLSYFLHTKQVCLKVCVCVANSLILSLIVCGAASTERPYARTGIPVYHFDCITHMHSHTYRQRKEPACAVLCEQPLVCAVIISSWTSVIRETKCNERHERLSWELP